MGKYGAGDVNKIAQNLSANTAGVSFQELQARLNKGLSGSGGGYDPNAGNAALAAANAQLAAVRAQIAAQPKLLNFDYSGAGARARAAAESAINPYYTKRLNDFVTEQTRKRNVEQQQAQMSHEELNTGLTNALQESGINRARTGEDTALKLGQIADTSQNYQQDTGQQFEQQRTERSGQLAQSGLTTSGLGAQQMTADQTARNVQEGRQTKEFQAQTAATNLFKTRTFEDLARSDKLTTEQTAFKNKGVDFSLKNTIDALNAEEQNYRGENEYKRLNDIVGESARQYQGILGQFLADQAAHGARAQDIQATKSAFGV
jgi:hypothetical protein